LLLGGDEGDIAFAHGIAEQRQSIPPGGVITAEKDNMAAERFEALQLFVRRFPLRW
jgi:hypothetical protein